MLVDRSVKDFLENKNRQKSNECEFLTNSKSKLTQQSSKVISSSSDDETTQENKAILESEKALEQTQSLQMANPQLLRPEDYVRLRLNSFLNKNETMVTNDRCSDMNVMNCKNNKLLGLGNRCHKSNDELIGSKGFCSYVTFVTSYVIFLVIITFLLSQIGKI